MEPLRIRRALTLSASASLFAGLLVACTFPLEISLFNNSGGPAVVPASGRSSAILQGEVVQFRYPSDTQNWTLRVATANCEFLYQVPRSLEHYPWAQAHRDGVKAQLEGDFSIILLPPDAAKTVPAVDVGSLQQDGFPIRPISKSCH